ncbi:capsular polysaccharide transport system permease protein [Donghicola tyrosinivorans]|uniref:Capsular polysaccharide transport system permease protein n=2 Tax=Donghicola tyrosinivorans TaxID=1652492 RepID=A0A2T0WXU6_9RHOB|nr:capsular polysaccharide transport system permease protein [Donghicola tyrosinivorans]
MNASSDSQNPSEAMRKRAKVQFRAHAAAKGSMTEEQRKRWLARRKLMAAKAARAKALPIQGQKAGAKPKHAARPAPVKLAPPPPPAPTVIEIAPPAERMTLKARHWGLIASFVLAVILPTVLSIWYLVAIAQDQFASRTGFTVRSEEGGSATDLLGGLASITGGNANGDANILFEYIQSQEIVRRLEDNVNLNQMFAQNWPNDPVFALWPDASIEDLVWFWDRILKVSFDQGTGMIDLEVRAYTPQDARTIVQEIVAASQELVNEINANARDDLMRYAESDLAAALERLKGARQALTEFRTRNQIVDPNADIQGQMGVVNTLQQQLANALIELDLLTGRTPEGDPRLEQAERRIEVIRERIASERADFVTNQLSDGGRDYPALLAEYEGLVVDQQFAEETYRSALAALDLARDKASRQSRYLATYVAPTMAESAEYPKRLMLIGLIALFLTLIWSILAMIYYSLRDRR